MGRNSLVILGALSALLLGMQPAMSAGKIGKVVAVVGQPSANGPGGSRKLSSGGDVYEDDRVVVKTGNAQILLDDGTRIVVGPASTLLLDQFVKKDKRTASKVAIKALRGTYRFITGRSAKSAYKITTAQATIGIRGTGFDFWVKNKTGAAVINGSVNLRGLNRGLVQVDAGCRLGEASNSSARPVTGRDKARIIRENLPFLLDQSSLGNSFRLNIRACNIGVGGIETDDNAPNPVERQRDPDPTDNPDNPDNPDGCHTSPCQ